MNENKQPADPNDALIGALQTMATTTEADPVFAAQLEAQLVQRAEQLQEVTTPWWRQLFHVQPYNQNWMRPVHFRPAVGVVLVLLALLLIATPPVRATVWDWLYGFGLIEERAVEQRPFTLDVPTVQVNRPLTLAEIRAHAPFAVALPTWLPADLIFTGGFVEETAAGAQVTLAYHLIQEQTPYPPAAPLLFLLISDGSIANQPLLAQDKVIPVQIASDRGTVIGMYAHGGWRSRQPVTPDATTVEDLYWDATADEAWLSWQAEKHNYLLYAQGLAMDQAALIAVAESMRVE